MSTRQNRVELAAALSGVPDVTGHERRPSAPAIGDAWPVLGPLDRAQGTAFLVTWRVRLVLPQDEDEASTWIDDHWPPLFYALEPLGSVRRAVPTMLTTSAGDLYALEITLITEE